MIKKIINRSIEIKKHLLEEKYINQIKHIGNTLTNTLGNKHKIVIAGNGGSAADAQHFAAELVNRFEVEREGLPAISLTTDSSIMTSIANDYAFEKVFSRQVESLGNRGDIFLGISTSGNSPNITYALKTARKIGLTTVGLLGNDGGKAKKHCDLALIVPSKSTARIQECHIMILHIWCQMIDKAFGT